MKLIPLTQGKFAKVDDEDYEWLIQWKWHAVSSRRGMAFYACRKAGPYTNRVSILMHRQIVGLDITTKVDHYDRDGLNNQRYNVRTATNSQNGANRKLGAGRRYIGVSKDHHNSWVARCKKDGIVYKLWALSESGAALKYNMLAIYLHGEFATINKVGDAYLSSTI